ncbi:hypothetical protein F53441_7195 [Fusarium austroafricanum]|uniref:Uncharacterized protein n=1 Tax=Fusarium austroafricanum TaxID=2364996 RepID=A0A8H4NYP1_9HYPO|nr:hypothetical protein F53441_7195 [Fusarium austroafricanum]
MARPQKWKRDQVEDPLPNQISSKQVKPNFVRPGPSRTQNQKARADDQIPCDNRNHIVSPRLSSAGIRKRRADDTQEHNQSKKLGSSDTVHKPLNFPPEFYNNLSKVWLMPRALRELDQRNEKLPPSKSTTGVNLVARSFLRLQDLVSQNLPLPSSGGHYSRDGVPFGLLLKQPADEINQADNTLQGPPHLSSILQIPRRPPANLNEIRQALKVPRGSLSLSVASKEAFEDFQHKNTTKSEGTVMRNIIPLIAGDAYIPNEGHLPFTNLASITEDTTVNPNPDFFDGAHPEAVGQGVREALYRIIIPTKKADTPIAPKLFLEAKSSGGSLDVAEGQAILDGAYGTIIMHSLQNRLLDKPMYDDNAYTFTATFLGGSSPLDFYDFEMFAEQGYDQETEETQDTHQTNVGLAILNYAYGKDDEDSADVSTGFAASLTPSFTSATQEGPLHPKPPPKLPRSPPSPSSTR